MEGFSYEQIEESPQHVAFSVKLPEGEGEISMSNFQSFPREWKVEITMQMKLTDDQTIRLYREIIELAAETVKKRGGKRLVTILDSRSNSDKDEEILRSCGFVTYFRHKHSVLDLTEFDVRPPDLEHIEITSWSDVNVINHSDESYLQALRDLYQVEYEADYEVRATGRWDQFNPDPEEFVKRFTSGEAEDELMWVAFHGDSIVGLTYPWIENKETAGIFFTGTIPKYTRQQIATTLKIHLALSLKKRGFSKLVTHNRTTNTAILRTNDKLGFVPTHSRLFLKKDL